MEESQNFLKIVDIIAQEREEVMNEAEQWKSLVAEYMARKTQLLAQKEELESQRLALVTLFLLSWLYFVRSVAGKMKPDPKNGDKRD